MCLAPAPAFLLLLPPTPPLLELLELLELFLASWRSMPLRLLPLLLGAAAAHAAAAASATAGGFSFTHPGVIVGSADLARIKAAVASKSEPEWSAFNAAANSTTFAYGGLPPFRAGLLNYSSHPQRMHANGSGITAMRESAIAAYTHGLLYAGDGDERRCALMRQIMDGWTHSPPEYANWTVGVGLQNGLQVAWGASLWPRAAEIARHYCPGEWPGAAAFGAWMVKEILPQVDEGASTNGNIGLVMTEVRREKRLLCFLCSLFLGCP